MSSAGTANRINRVNEVSALSETQYAGRNRKPTTPSAAAITIDMIKD